MTLLFLIPAIWLIGGYIMFRIACFRGKDTDWTDEASVRATEFGPFWDYVCKARAYLAEHNARGVSITSHDGLKLKALWLPAENPKATMILFHGYHSSFLVDFSGIYRLYHDQGYNLLLVHQRSHGESQGRYITFGVRERLDALNWIEYHNETFGTLPVFLCGMSMGTATVTFAAGEALPHNVRGITADCGFTSPYDILLHVGTKTAGSWVKVLMPAVDLWARMLAGFSLRECESTKTLAKTKVPILMIHGTADNYVPCTMTQAGFNACASEKELILVEDAGHGTSFLKDRARVEPRLLDFFQRNLY